MSRLIRSWIGLGALHSGSIVLSTKSKTFCYCVLLYSKRYITGWALESVRIVRILRSVNNLVCFKSASRSLNISCILNIPHRLNIS